MMLSWLGRTHLAITYTANQWPVIYINGIQNDNTTTTGSVPVAPNNWGAGAYGESYIARSASGNYFDGYLKDFRIYSKALR
jgi:hypothetical protein